MFKTNNEHYKQLIAGAGSAVITRCICQPLDVLKIRFQLQVEPLGMKATKESKYKSLAHAIKLIYREEGVLAFWKGHNPAQVLSIIYGTAQFWTYEQCILLTKKSKYLSESPNASNFIGGCIAGGVAYALVSPIDVIRTRLIAQDKKKGYNSATSAFGRIIETEGFGGLYRGLLSALMQNMPLMGASFMFYRLFGNIAAVAMDIDDRKKLPSWILLSLGAFSGTLSKTLVYPFDLIRKRLQIQGFDKHRKTYGTMIICNGIIKCIRQTVKKEGYLGLYKGMIPTLLKTGSTTALHFVFYDKIYNFMSY